MIVVNVDFSQKDNEIQKINQSPTIYNVDNQSSQIKDGK